MHKFLLPILIFFFSFVFFLAACTAEPPGVFGDVTFVVGKAYLRSPFNPQKKEKELQRGFPVHFEDEIRTEKKSAVELQLKSYGLIRVGENTIFRLSELEKGKRIEVRVNQGKAGFFINKLPEDQEILVKTPTVIAAIRGTRFLVTSDEQQESKVALFGGAVEVRNESGRVVLDKQGEIRLKKGMLLDASSIQPLSPESIAEMKALENMNAIEMPREPLPLRQDLQRRKPPKAAK